MAANKTDKTGPAPEPKAAPKGKVKVTATRHLCEGGEHYNPGEELVTTPARAKALGKLIAKD